MASLAGGPELPGVLGELAPLLDRYGYAAIAVLIILEDFGIPAPGETVLIAGAVYAGAGRLNIAAVAMVAFAAAVVGDNIGYGIGRYGGRALVVRYGRYLGVTERRWSVAERFFNRHGPTIVAVARFVEGLRQLNGLIAGAAGMRWRRFLMFNALGAGLWVGVWAALGYLAGTHITAIYQQAQRYQIYLLAGLAALVAAGIARRLLKRRHHRGDTKRR